MNDHLTSAARGRDHADRRAGGHPMIAGARSPWVALAAGAGSAFAFQPAGLWPLMLLAFAALLHLLSSAATLRRALLTGWLFGLGQFVIGLNWIATAFTFQAAMPAWLGWIAVVLLSLYLAVYPMLAAGLAWRIGRGAPPALVLCLAGAWGITEWLRAGIFTGFAWNPVGVVLADTPFLTLAPWLGTYGLSALVVALAGVFWLEARRRPVVALAVLGLLSFLFFVAADRIPDLPRSGKPIRVVQPNIGQQDKWRPGFADEAARRLSELSGRGGQAAGPRLLFWPEAAVTEPLEDGREGPRAGAVQFERARAASNLRPGERLLTGGLALMSSDGRTVDSAANSVFLIAPDSRVLARYDKAHLVPYGEYLPMRPLLSAVGLSRLAPGDVDFDSGPGPRTLDLGAGFGRAGLQICYEIIFSGEVVDRRNRPDFLFNPSNDAWFGAWGPPQHLAQARLRAAEEALPVVRSTPTGISAVIDSHGGIVASIPWREAGAIDTFLPPPGPPTPFSRLGNWLPLSQCGMLVALAIALVGRRRYRRT